jgi:hypothetical protein
MQLYDVEFQVDEAEFQPIELKGEELSAKPFEKEKFLSSHCKKEELKIFQSLTTSQK